MFLVENKTEGTCLTRKNGFLPPKMNCHTVTLSQMKFFFVLDEKSCPKIRNAGYPCCIFAASFERHGTRNQNFQL